MFGRLLGFLAFIPGLSGYAGMASGYGSGTATEDGLEADGEAAVSFTPGQRIASSDSEETPDSRQERITERDLVWPGKVETIHISNPGPIMYRFDLTVTDLNPAFYLRRQPQGGVPQREGGILLQPGQEASFEVAFVPPPAGDKRKSQTFSFVLTLFDPRRSSESGEIVQDLPLRWVALPSETDLQISAAPPVVVTRPWRREAKFAVQFTNKSFLPPLVSMTILRAPTKEALQKDAETVGTIEQSLVARTPGVWQCLLPPPARRASYYATISGSAQTAEGISTPLALTRPVLIRYIPWLRLGRDWAFLIGSLLLLFWLVWGIPVRKTPVVRATVAFAGLDRGEMPPDTKLSDLSAQMILLDERGHDLEGQPPIPGVVISDAFEFTGPSRTFGFHWLFGHHPGWNFWSKEKQRFRITVATTETAKSAFKHYDLNALQADGTPEYSAADSVTPFGSLTMPTTVMAPTVHSVLINLKLGHLGALAGRDLHRVSVQYMLGGEQQPTKTFEVLHDTSGGLRPITLDLTDAIPLGGSKRFAVKVTADGLSSEDIQEIEVQRRSQPLPITLTFPDSYPPKPASTAPKPKAAPIKPLTVPGKPLTVPGKPPATPGGPGAPHPANPVGGPVPTRPHLAIGIPPIKGPMPKTGPTTPTGPVSSTGRTPGSPIPLFHGPVSMPGTGPSQVPLHPPPSIVKKRPITSGSLAAPTGLVSRPVSPTQINLSWDPAPGTTKYILYRSGGQGSGKGVRVIPANQTSFADTGLTPGIVYQYRVQSKRGSSSSPLSNQTSSLTPAAAAALAVTVQLTVTVHGKNLDAALDFFNASSRALHLDKVSACDRGKVGDDVFQIQVDGQTVPFSGHKAQRSQPPSLNQFLTILPGEHVHENVDLGRSYHLPSGAHTYRIVYSGRHAYPYQQAMTLTSNEFYLEVSKQ